MYKIVKVLTIAVVTIIVPEEKSSFKGGPKRHQKGTKNLKIFTRKGPPAGTERRQWRKMVIPNIFIFNMVLSRVDAPLIMSMPPEIPCIYNASTKYIDNTYFSKFIF